MDDIFKVLKGKNLYYTSVFYAAEFSFKNGVNKGISRWMKPENFCEQTCLTRNAKGSFLAERKWLQTVILIYINIIQEEVIMCIIIEDGIITFLLLYSLVEM